MDPESKDGSQRKVNMSQTFGQNLLCIHMRFSCVYTRDSLAYAQDILLLHVYETAGCMYRDYGTVGCMCADVYIILFYRCITM